MRKSLILTVIFSILMINFNLFALDKAGMEKQLETYQQQKASVEKQIRQYQQRLRDSLITVERFNGAIVALENLLVQEEKAEVKAEKTETEEKETKKKKPVEKENEKE